MNLSNQDLKLLAKRKLKKTLSQIIGVSSVFLVANILLGFLTRYLISMSNHLIELLVNLLILAILSLFINILCVGYIYYLLRLILKKEDAGYSDLLYGFKTSADKIIAATFLSSILTYIWLVPGFVFLVLYYITGYQQELYVALFMLFLLIGISISCFVALSLSQTLFLIAETPSITIRNAFQSSMQLMKGQKSSLLYLYLSFIGLFMVGVFTFYLGFLVIVPYFYLTRTYYYLNVSQQLTRQNVL